MAKSLGGQNGVTLTVYNSTTATIPSGRAVRWEADPVTTGKHLYEVGPEEHVIAVELADAIGDTEEFIGITQNSIDPGDTGTVISYGVVLCETDGGVTALDPVEGAATGVVTTSAAGFGIALETDRTESIQIDTDLGTGSRVVAYCLVGGLRPFV